MAWVRPAAVRARFHLREHAYVAEVVALIDAVGAGGRTSHTAILAAQMGIPAVVQCPDATSLPAGTRVAVDGDSGEVTIAPTGEFVEGLRERREKRAAALTATSGDGRTSDGFHVALLANIGGIKDAEEAGDDVDEEACFVESSPHPASRTAGRTASAKRRSRAPSVSSR